jgi:hypothetical protein
MRIWPLHWKLIAVHFARGDYWSSAPRRIITVTGDWCICWAWRFQFVLNKRPEPHRIDTG